MVNGRDNIPGNTSPQPSKSDALDESTLFPIESNFADNSQVLDIDGTDAKVIWQTVQNELRAKLGERVHLSWTGQLSLFGSTDTSVSLCVPSQFVAGRIDNKYGDLVRSLWAVHDTRDVIISAEAQAAQRAKRADPKIPSQDTPTANTARRTAAAPSAEPRNTQSSRRAPAAAAALEAKQRRFTFDNFVVGPSNELAFAVAKRVAGQDHCQYNPVLIHGPHGLGKTHLLHAVKSAALAGNPNRRVKLITAEDFVAQFVQSVRASGRSEIEAFKASLRDVDMLIIDDAHFIADKPGSQEELLHTLIALVDEGKQVLIACDRHPHAIEKAGPRLTSYLCSGLLCDIGATDYELRLRLLDRLITKRRDSGHPGLSMPQNARDHLAARINATPRDLEGAFNQVVARSEFLGCPLTLENVQEALAHSRYTGMTRPTIDAIQRATALHFSIGMDELLSRRRTRNVARPRQVAMYLSKTLTTRSLPDIGRRFAGRDHTTVLHAVRKIEEVRAQDKDIDMSIEAITQKLKSPK